MRVHANWFKLLLPSSSSSPFISSRSSFSSRLSGNWDGMCRVEWIEETSFRIHRNLTLIRLCCNCNKMHRFAWQFGSIRISIRTRRRMIIIEVLHKRWSPTLHCGCTIFVPIKQLRHTHTEIMSEILLLYFSSSIQGEGCGHETRKLTLIAIAMRSE